MRPPSLARSWSNRSLSCLSRRRQDSQPRRACLTNGLSRLRAITSAGRRFDSDGIDPPDLADRLATQAHTPPDAAALAGLADQLGELLATESSEQAKELLRLLVKEIRVHSRRRIVPTYRVPVAVRAMPTKVGGAGLEPATSCL